MWSIRGKYDDNLYQTACARPQGLKADMPQVTVDLHCDTLTAHPEFGGQFRLDEFESGTMLLQCLAIFTPDETAATFVAAENLFYGILRRRNLRAVKNYSELERAKSSGERCVALTCENIGFTHGDYDNIRALKKSGVIMASLVWNEENCLAYPNVCSAGREKRGLKPLGRKAVEYLDEMKIIVDISHLSDGGAVQILKGRKIPAVASHSCCNTVTKNSRNLTDSQLKLIADCGGVVGVNFYSEFLGGGDPFERVYSHIRRIIDVAGEDTPAFGSDWDGVPEYGKTLYPRDMPRLLEFLHERGISLRTVEKIACGNFLRVFKEVCKG